MWLEDFIPDESWSESWPKSSEISEKFKESIKKSSAWIKRVQKDEKKAKKFDALLSGFLVDIVKNSKYDFLLNYLFKLLSSWFPSSFILWLISIIYLPISDKIRELSKKDLIDFKYTKTFQQINFNDSNIDKEIKDRINNWIEDIIDISSIEFSAIQLDNLKKLYKEEENKLILLEFCSFVFIFFFKELNINITKEKSFSYVSFIMSEIFKSLNKVNIDEV